jgi:rfaE bifunctional protein nucleotidyltransferase chain/domain
MNKIYNSSSLKKIINILKSKGKKIVLCHGAFDLFHPGHLDHLAKAKEKGHILVVSITKDKYIKKSIKNPFYNQNQRANFLANINLVDYVCISENSTAITVLNDLKPNFYCKGEEYKKSDSIGNLIMEKNFCKKNKIKLIFIGKPKFSSSQIISENFFNSHDLKLNKEIKENIIKKKTNIDENFNNIKKLKVLIIGEILLDKYTYVTTKGTSPKSSTLSSTINYSETMPGGTFATYKFVRQFCKNVKLLSPFNLDLIGKNKKIFSKEIIRDLKLFNVADSLIKERIVEIDKVENIKKMLTLNHFEYLNLEKNTEKKIILYLLKEVKKFDLVIVQDFGHGFINDKIAKIIQKYSKFLSINVQTNSLNYGFNLINKKFSKADLLSLDKRELELYAGKKDINYEKCLKKLSNEMHSNYCFLTCGDEFSLGMHKKTSFKIKTLETKVVDTMGAGDIFHAMSSLMAKTNCSLFLNLFISQIAGALAVKIPGNKDFPKIDQIKRTYDLFVKSIR